MKTTKKLLSINNLKKYFPVPKSSMFSKEQLYVRANEDISIDIYEGETFGLVGESGCGKSTFGRVLLQIYEQTAGTAIYYGSSRDDVAPAYVEDTLKNATKYVEHYKKEKERAEKLTEECEQLGEDATFFQIQNKNLAIAEAETALTNVAKIIGGFVADGTAVGAEILSRLHKVNVEKAALTRELKELNIEIAYAKEGMEEDNESKKESRSSKISKKEKEKEELVERIKKNRATQKEIKAELDEVKKKYSGNEEFQHFEAMLDDGIDLARLKYNEIRHLRNDLQIIFQDPYSSLNPRMTIGQIIEEGLVTHNFYKHGSQQMKEHILETMKECGLQDFMIHRYPHQFSGGQRQRVCIARSLAVRPKFVVCDECVSALDVSIQSQIINLLEELKEKEKLTYLFISHDLSVVRYISDRIGVMYLGNIVELADAETIFKDPRHPYTVALLSSIPTVDAADTEKDRIVLEGNIPSPVRPPSGCKFHTRCFMATELCKRVPPPLVEVEKGHCVACHFPEQKINEKGEYLFDLPKMEKKSLRIPTVKAEQ